jgi:hypothetical protein
MVRIAASRAIAAASLAVDLRGQLLGNLIPLNPGSEPLGPVHVHAENSAEQQRG